MATDRPDATQQVPAVRRLDQVNKAISNFKRHWVKSNRRFQRGFGSRLAIGRYVGCRSRSGTVAFFGWKRHRAGATPSEEGDRGAHQQERELGQTGYQSQ